MKNLILSTMLFLVAVLNPFTMEAQYKNTLNLANDAIKYWEQGEKTGNYESFKKMISPDFNFFSHPLFGISNGATAKNNFENVIKQREKMPNSLTFSDVKVTASEKDYAIIAFTSQGKVMGGQFDYSGYNTIAFGFKNNTIISFREYLGSDDLLKFSKMMASISKEDAKATIDTYFKASLDKNDVLMNEIMSDDYVGVSIFGTSVDKAKYIEIHKKLTFSIHKSIEESIRLYDGFAIIVGTAELKKPDDANSKKQLYTAVIKKNSEGKLNVISFHEVSMKN